MATVPVPRTWVAGENPTAAILNGPTGVRDPMSFLLAPPRLSVYHSTTITPGAATFVVHPWDTEVWDTDGMHAAGQNTRLVATTPGMYSVSAAIMYAGNASGIRAIQLRKNAGGSNSGGSLIGQVNSGLGYTSAATSVQIIQDVTLAAADYLEVFAYTSPGGIATVAGSAFSWASMRLVATS